MSRGKGGSSSLKKSRTSPLVLRVPSLVGKGSDSSRAVSSSRELGHSEDIKKGASLAKGSVASSVQLSSSGNIGNLDEPGGTEELGASRTRFENWLFRIDPTLNVFLASPS